MASDTVERRLAVIFAADMVGYSRLMEIDEEDTIRRQNGYRKNLIDPMFAKYDGRIVKLMGDGMLVEFSSVVNAVQCAVDIQSSIAIIEADTSEDRCIRYRVGINLGDIIIDGDDILGDGVNVAARIEGLALPGGICISDVVHQSVAGKMNLSFEDLGDQKVKNISRPLRVFRVLGGRVNTKTDLDPDSDTAPDKPSIAVLAFNNMSGDSEQEYFSDGISEDIITGLSRFKDLLVIARNTSFTYKGQAVDIKQVGQELGVRYVLEGSVRRGGNRVRVTGQLIDTQTGGHVWADRYDGNLDDIFELQDDITEKVLNAVGTEITLAEIERSRRERPDSIDAWDKYLRALPLYYQISQAGHEQAKALLFESMRIAPEFSNAYALLALCYIQAAYHGWEASARSAIRQAEELAQNAVDLDPDDAAAQLAFGWIDIFSTRPEQSLRKLERAIELNPNLSTAFGVMSNSLAFAGRSEEALTAYAQATRGSPRDPERYLWHIGAMNAHFAAEEYRECVESAEQAILLKPSFYGAYFISAAALANLGRSEDAQKMLQTALSCSPRLTLANTSRNPMFAREKDVANLLEGLKLAGLKE